MEGCKGFNEMFAPTLPPFVTFVRALPRRAPPGMAERQRNAADRRGRRPKVGKDAVELSNDRASRLVLRAAATIDSDAPDPCLKARAPKR